MEVNRHVAHGNADRDVCLISVVGTCLDDGRLVMHRVVSMVIYGPVQIHGTATSYLLALHSYFQNI